MVKGKKLDVMQVKNSIMVYWSDCRSVLNKMGLPRAWAGAEQFDSTEVKEIRVDMARKAFNRGGDTKVQIVPQE